MNSPRSTRQADAQPRQTADPARKRPKVRVVRPHAEERLTSEEWKLRFAENLDRLVGLVGLSRKDAAHEMGVSYRLLRRVITAGVSRTEDRNVKSLTKIAGFFCLPSVEDLWRADLVRWLVYSTDIGFIEKFRTRLEAERKKRVEEVGPLRREELALLNHALGFEDEHVPMLTGPYANKVASILASPEAETFRRLIDAYDELVQRRAAEAERQQEGERGTA